MEFFEEISGKIIGQFSVNFREIVRDFYSSKCMNIFDVQIFSKTAKI